MGLLPDLFPRDGTQLNSASLFEEGEVLPVVAYL